MSDGLLAKSTNEVRRMHVANVRLLFKGKVSEWRTSVRSAGSHRFSNGKEFMYTDKIPTANIDIASAFCKIFMFNFHICAVGSMITHTSSTMSMPEC